MNSFFLNVVRIIKRIPFGKVVTYGQIAAMAGNPQAARSVAWILHSSSQKHQLPWHRVVNRLGRISLPHGGGCEVQKQRLEREGVDFDKSGRIDFKRFLWRPGRKAGRFRDCGVGQKRISPG